MLVKIKSDNPNFLSVLQKNPTSFDGIQLKKIRNGVGIGYILNSNEYHLIFQDTKYSFSEDATNQIDFQSYCNSRVFLSLASTFLRHVLVAKKVWLSKEIPWCNATLENLDVSGTHSIEIENIYADGFYSQYGFVLEKYFPEVKLTLKSGRLYSLKVETNKSLFHLINLTALTCMYMAATNKQRWHLNKNIVQKYVRIIKNIQPIPYFILYLFVNRCIVDEQDFILSKTGLESAFDGDIKLTWGNTQESRIQEVGMRLLTSGEINSNVIEIGCGNMSYPKKFLGKLKREYIWIANDISDYEYAVNKINNKFNTNQLHFVSGNDLDLSIENKTILMIEVIEHMPFKESQNLFRKVLLSMNRDDRLIVTTPNKTFNQNFGFEEGRVFRHDDHHFELTENEFYDYVASIALEQDFSIEFFGIGDEVNGEHLSLGAFLCKV